MLIENNFFVASIFFNDPIFTIFSMKNLRVTRLPKQVSKTKGFSLSVRLAVGLWNQYYNTATLKIDKCGVKIIRLTLGLGQILGKKYRVLKN